MLKQKEMRAAPWRNEKPMEHGVRCAATGRVQEERGSGPVSWCGGAQASGPAAGLLQGLEHFDCAFNVDLIFGEDQRRALESGDRQLFQRAHLTRFRV